MWNTLFPRLRVSHIFCCHALLQILGPWPWWPWLQFGSMLASPIQRRIETLLTSSNWTSRNPYSQEWGTEAVKIPTDNIKIPTENIKIPTHPIKIPTSPIKIPTSPIKIPTDQSKSLHDCRDFDCRDYDCRDFDCRDSETLPVWVVAKQGHFQNMILGASQFGSVVRSMRQGKYYHQERESQSVAMPGWSRPS